MKLLIIRWFFEDGIIRRVTGPLHFRFILQPAMAVLIGIRDGLMDSKAGNPPYILGMFTQAENRRELIANGLKSISKVLILGIVLEFIAQYLIFGTVRLIPALILGFVLIVLPYSLARAITNRAASSWARRESARHTRPA